MVHDKRKKYCFFINCISIISICFLLFIIPVNCNLKNVANKDNVNNNNNNNNKDKDFDMGKERTSINKEYFFNVTWFQVQFQTQVSLFIFMLYFIFIFILHFFKKKRKEINIYYTL